MAMPACMWHCTVHVCACGWGGRSHGRRWPGACLLGSKHMCRSHCLAESYAFVSNISHICTGSHQELLCVYLHSAHICRSCWAALDISHLSHVCTRLHTSRPLQALLGGAAPASLAGRLHLMPRMPAMVRSTCGPTAAVSAAVPASISGKGGDVCFQRQACFGASRCTPVFWTQLDFSSTHYLPSIQGCGSV